METEPAVVVAGECDDPHCPREVTEPGTGATLFTSQDAMHAAARASGWFVGSDVLGCPLHVRRRRGLVVGTRFERARRDLGIRVGSWYEE